MGFFIARRAAECDRVDWAIDALQERCEREGAAAVVDEVWQHMMRCYLKMDKGKTWYIPLVLRTSKFSFGLHAQLGRWFGAAASGFAFGVAVRMLDAVVSEHGMPFPQELRPDIQLMTDTAVDVAHRAGLPLMGCLLADAVTGLQMSDRTIVRELSPLLSGDDAIRRLRALRRSVQDSAKRARSLPETTGANSIAAARQIADDMLISDMDSTLADVTRGIPLSTAGTATALLAASHTGRSVVYVVPGLEVGAAFRLQAPEPGRELCQSISLPGLGLEAVRTHLKTLLAVLASDERRIRVRDQAVREAQAAVADAVWKPILNAWPEIRGARVALIPVGEAALLPLYTAPVDGVPVCGLTDLTIAPSSNSLMFAGAWPRPSRMDPLIVADPWYDDGVGGKPIPFTVPEARAVAATHGVAPMILREVDQVPDEEGRDRLRGLDASPGPAELTGSALPDLERRLTSANLIHLAGHGFLDAQKPLGSALLLGHPRLLSALLEHDLQRGTTVVLSACHLAGIGTQAPGEQLGFPAAMLAMGASSVIAALWSVPDSEQTVRLMSSFHDELSRGALPSAALGTAIARAAADGVRPAVWAPFTHFGA